MGIRRKGINLIITREKIMEIIALYKVYDSCHTLIEKDLSYSEMIKLINTLKNFQVVVYKG